MWHYLQGGPPMDPSEMDTELLYDVYDDVLDPIKR